ncbi:MAG: 8-amino-7-oxononanoate synthase [Ginsengibacter sp.]
MFLTSLLSFAYMNDDDFLLKRLRERQKSDAFRRLTIHQDKVDFCSNDYLGISKNHLINTANNDLSQGSTGSRLLSGNYELIEETEKFITHFHDAAAGLIFNSGYDANIGLLSSVPQKDDVIIYDHLSHASIRDGIRLSFAQSFSFKHSDITDLEKKLSTAEAKGNLFVVTESVFSMDGDIGPLKAIASLCEKYNAALIVDEAHATGVIGEKGEGEVQRQNLQAKCFARIHTFGKACGCHGAIVLGSDNLRNYLINFSRAFIYTTALPPSAIHAISNSYKLFPGMLEERAHLQKLVELFNASNHRHEKIKSETPIQVIIVPGNAAAKALAEQLQHAGFEVRAILYPTVPKGAERLRIVLHSFNTLEDTQRLMALLQ